jgi:Transcriptional regulator containing PAS, AAA-type ATPase, and DNA-binding domains
MEITNTTAAIFDVLSEGILIIDTEARIIFANKAYCAFLGIDFPQLKAMKLRDIRPGARLPEVLRTGKPILHAPRQEVEDIYIANMYPVYNESEIVGGISVVTFLQQAFQFKEVLDEIKQRSDQILRRISKASNTRYTFDDIIANDPLSLQTKALAQRAAATETTVLLQAESGTGKELYAQAIHNASQRSNGIFLAINCASFNANTLESELFGYTEGAFTGAKKGGKIGLFEAAAGGTLFLDEVSEMDVALQAKLLRALQEYRIRPIGSVEERSIDVRIIAACNADLKQLSEEGRFRPDLYYRLSIFPIFIPPLRERKNDIDALAFYILDDLSKRMKKSIYISQVAMRCLKQYDWPGNVRELRNVLEFLAYLSDDNVINETILPSHLARNASPDTLTLSQRVKAFERNEIQKALQLNGKHLEGKKKTARQLGISLSSLYSKINEQ